MCIYKNYFLIQINVLNLKKLRNSFIYMYERGKSSKDTSIENWGIVYIESNMALSQTCAMNIGLH